MLGFQQMTNYHIESYNMSAGKHYVVAVSAMFTYHRIAFLLFYHVNSTYIFTVQVQAYHGSNCIHDIIKLKTFQSKFTESFRVQNDVHVYPLH